MKIVFAIFALLGLLVASPSLLNLAKQAEWNREHAGYYYCPQSLLYGKAKPGVWMSQAQALQIGYRSATGEFCR